MEHIEHIERLKFRAWDNYNQRMLKVKSIHFNDEGIAIVINPLEFISSKYVELMQYTGLKDKNGAEIYEGDIANISIDDGLIYVNEALATIEFDRGCFECKELDGVTYCLSEVQEIQVIGNVFENPELLDN